MSKHRNRPVKAASQIVTLKDIERHVLDDALELIATIGLANPLMNTMRIFELEDPYLAPALFLRTTLSRHVVLVTTRLHALRGIGNTGETASIESYLHYAEVEGALLTAQADIFRSNRQDMILKLEADGIPFAELTNFRNAELAHSLHRSLPSTNKLVSLPIWDFAHNTYELVLKIEKAVSGTAKLDTKFQEWLDYGLAFWPKDLDP
jgi:hypothetical protein